MKEKNMEIAYDMSMKNKGNNFKDGGPFGAVLVDKNNNVIEVACNSVLESIDPTAHAEVNLIRKACKKLGTIDLSDYTLYTSCYPCPMCLSAIMWANVKHVYYGNTKEDAENIGFKDKMIYDYLETGDKSLLELEQINREITIKAFEEFSNTTDKMMY